MSNILGSRRGFITIYKRIFEEHKRLENQIHVLQNQLRDLPEGKLICTKNGNTYKWYVSDGHKMTYIPKKNKKYAEQLAIRKYISTELDKLLKEKRAIEYYLRHHTETDRTEELFDDKSEYRKLLMPFFKPVEEELSQWMQDYYNGNPNYPEQLNQKCKSGHIVRSKSEAMIDLYLFENKIPFRYECKLQLGEIILYPDFTIRHPKTGEFYYWEHFGMMDNPAYVKNAFSKQLLYAEHGIIPSIQLITTYETKEHPLTIETIEKVIQSYWI